MNARRFTSLAWVAAIGLAVLTCYIFSARVAEERADLSDLEAQILRTERSIRTLKTELGTRGRVHQLQYWASADFGFTAPTADQFLDSEVRLASLDAPMAVPVTSAPVRMAAAEAPAMEAPAPAPVRAVAPRPAPERPAVRQASAPVQPQPALLRRAVAEPAREPVLTRAAAARPARPSAAPARITASLVGERTLRDLDRRARAEREPATARSR